MYEDEGGKAQKSPKNHQNHREITKILPQMNISVKQKILKNAWKWG